MGHQWKTKLTPNAETHLDFSRRKGRHHIACPIGQYLFEVLSSTNVDIVDLEKKICTCGVFHTIGLPCSHAMAAITKRNYDEYDFCQPWYLTEKYRDTYEEVVLPTLDRSQWQVPPHSLVYIIIAVHVAN
ncbi:uncharacterized protein LOC143882887 [Tasmannia lanceolata]|uniref:uncharacterized protein LOC143882887 n=1 Tax=Tasmannia lanceolata TaxID=3420 RepID=UPI004064A23A